MNLHEFKNNVFEINNFQHKRLGSVNIQATQSIEFFPESNIDFLGSNALLTAEINPNLLEVADMLGNWQPEKYKRFEIGVRLPNSVLQGINNFLQNGVGINPYNPAEIKLECNFTSSAGTQTRFGFFYQDVYTTNNIWVTQNSNYPFRIRYAPPVSGNYIFEINCLVNNSIVSSFNGSFFVIDNNEKGHLVMAPGNYRKMMFENGEMFFAIGQNIPFALDDQSYICGTCSASPTTYDIQRNRMYELAQYEGNFVRIRMDPWSNPIITREQRLTINDPAPKSLAECLVDWSHNQKHMWELDKTISLCENYGLYVMLNILQDQYWSTFDRYQIGQKWEFNPFSTLLTPDDAGIANFFSDPLSKEYFKRMLFYIHSRWGYSAHLAIWEMINETENIGDHQTGGSLWDNDATLRNTVNDWTCEMKNYLEQIYPWHPTTSGFAGRALPSQQPICLNIWSQNSYHTNITNGQYQNANYNDRFNAASSYATENKPFVFGELGESLDAVCSTINEAMVMDFHSDRAFHNTVWATSMMGGIGTGLYWNDFESRNIDHRRNFLPLSRFLNQADWNHAYSIHRTLSSGDNTASTERILNLYMVSEDKSRIIGWSQIGSSYWLNETGINSPFYNYFRGLAGANYISQDPYSCEDNSSNPSFEFKDLVPYSNYYVQVWNTYYNTNYPQKLDDRTEHASAFGTIKFHRKSTFDIIYPWYPDYAFLMYRHGTYGSNVRISDQGNQDSTSVEEANDKVKSDIWSPAFLLKVKTNGTSTYYPTKFNFNDQNISCMVIDMTGRLIEVIPRIFDGQMELRKYLSGIYFIIIKNNHEREVRKFVVAN